MLLKDFKILDTDVEAGRGMTTTIATVSYEDVTYGIVEKRIFKNGSKYFVEDYSKHINLEVTNQYKKALKEFSNNEIDVEQIKRLAIELNFVAMASSQYKNVDKHLDKILELLG